MMEKFGVVPFFGEVRFVADHKNDCLHASLFAYELYPLGHIIKA